MSYGTDRVDAFRQVASFVDRILRGSNPGDLPVQTPTKYETVVNLKNGEGARPRSTVIAFGARRRGDRMRCERRMNPKCHSRTVCDTFSARSADSTGLFLMPITRREFITLLGGAAAAWPLAARAQQAAMPLVGYVSSASADASYMAAFRQGLADLGHTEGHNAAIEFRWADGKFERLPALLADLIQRRVAVIAVGGITSGLAAKAATTTIPIVFLAADDPVKFGLVTSLNRPGGNATGLNLLTSELNTKRLELIRDLVPTASAVAVLVNPRSPESEPQTRDIERVAGAVGQQIRILNASSDRDIDAAFATLIKPRDAALLVTNDALFDSSRVQIVALAASRAIPTIYDRRAYADAGGLMSYGTHYLDGHRRLGIYTAKILNGAKPADLPVEQSTKFELVINLKTAKALGLEVPPTLLARADEVIE